MMDMQEVKERRPHTQRHEDDDDTQETDPMVPRMPVSRRSQPESLVHFAMDKIWPVAFLTVACLGLYEADFVPQLLHARHANRNFVHLGIFFATLLGAFGAYIEVYRSLIRGENVNYESAKTATHGMLVSMLLSGFCLAVGMWPVWHWMTLPYLFMWSWGVVVQLLVILPPIFQRVVFVGAYVWFMHSYFSMLLIEESPLKDSFNGVLVHDQAKEKQHHSPSYQQTMKSLQCVAITDGRVFVVDIDDCKNVWFLMDMIQKHKMYNFPGHHLKLYVAKKDGEWLKPDDLMSCGWRMVKVQAESQR